MTSQCQAPVTAPPALDALLPQNLAVLVGVSPEEVAKTGEEGRTQHPRPPVVPSFRRCVGRVQSYLLRRYDWRCRDNEGQAIVGIGEGVELVGSGADLIFECYFINMRGVLLTVYTS